MPVFKNSKLFLLLLLLLLLLLFQQSGLQLKIAINTVVYEENSLLFIYSFSGCSYFRVK